MEMISGFFSVMMLTAALAQTLALRAFPIKHLARSISTAMGFGRRGAGGTSRSGKKGGSGTTPFQAMATALGGSIGTANIAGTASAIAIGGAGAVFYMWLAGIFGMALKFSEVLLAVKYREKRGGEYTGGPMSYMKLALGGSRLSSPALSRLASALAAAYAVFTLLASALGTPLVQANTVAGSAAEMLRAFGSGADGSAVFAVSGMVCAALTGIVVIGGARRIGRISALLVPFMALIYALVCMIVLIRFRANVLPSLARIFREALGLRAAGGGLAGACVSRCMRIGISRGVYSNEAGVGSSAMAHACAEASSPIEQGLYGVFEVFADTLVMCTLTALTVLASGAALDGGAQVSGASIALSAFSSVLGERAASVFLSVSLLLFAYTSLIGWSAYGLSAAKYLFGEKAKTPFCVIFTLLTALGAFVRVDIAWKCGEIFNYLMAAPNVFALLLLSKEIKKEIKFYE